MANNYCLSSTIYPLTPDQYERAEKIIEEVGRENEAALSGFEPGTEDYNECEPCIEFQYQFESEGIWVYFCESVNVEMMADVFSRFQVEFKAEKPFCFEYCYECSKPRVDEFGGGSFCIMPDGSQHHAGSRDDALQKAKLASQYAKVVWTAEDVKTLKPDWTDEQATEWLAVNQKHIQERLVEMGWEVMNALM
jgi:hypothetical protein